MINNILYLKYAIEVERTGSISKAAENLYMGQPQLSKAIRELEDSLGTPVFNRTSKGVVPTPKGEEFLEHAKGIIQKIDEMEAIYKPFDKHVQNINISVPRASYISYAFSELIKSFDLDKDIKLDYRETNSMRAIKNVSNNINDIAIIRFQSVYEKYFKVALEERDLKYQLLFEFEKNLLISKDHPLAVSENIQQDDLLKYTEIIHGDLSVPSLPIAEVRKLAKINEKKKCISVYERGSQLELLTRIPTTYMWVSPMPGEVLERYNLIIAKCEIPKNRFKDVLIYKRDYRLNPIEKQLIVQINEIIRHF